MCMRDKRLCYSRCAECGVMLLHDEIVEVHPRGHVRGRIVCYDCAQEKYERGLEW